MCLKVYVPNFYFGKSGRERTKEIHKLFLFQCNLCSDGLDSFLFFICPFDLEIHSAHMSAHFDDQI